MQEGKEKFAIYREQPSHAMRSKGQQAITTKDSDMRSINTQQQTHGESNYTAC